MKDNLAIGDNFNKKLTLYGFVMTFFIVFSHWTQFFGVTNPGSSVGVLESLYKTLGLLSLATFFMLSGFLFYRGVETAADLKGKILRRLVSLGIPFLVWNILYLLVDIAYGIYKGNLALTFKDIVLGFTLTPFDGPLWYLLALLLLACLSPAVLLLKKNRTVCIAVVAVVYAACVTVTALVSPVGYAAWFLRLLGYLPLYLVGAAFGMHGTEAVVAESYQRKPVFITAAVLAVAALLYFVFFAFDIAPLNTVIFHSMAVLCWIALPSSVFEGKRVCFPLTVSYFVYAMHSVLIWLLNWAFAIKILRPLELPLGVNAVIQIALIGILYLICLGVAFLLKKILPEKIYRIFAGGSAGRKLV